MAKQIEDLRQRHASAIGIIRRFRHKSGAHANARLENHLRVHEEFEKNKDAIFAFINDLFLLAAIIHKGREKEIPELDDAITRYSTTLRMDERALRELATITWDAHESVVQENSG